MKKNKDMQIYIVRFTDGKSGVFRQLTDLCKKFSTAELGIGLQALYNAFSHSKENVYRNKLCTITKGHIGDIR